MTLVKFNSENNKKNSSALNKNSVFDSIFNDTFFADRMVTRVPATNISETADHFHIDLAAPGLKKEDFKLKLEGDVLSISVEKMHQEHNRNAVTQKGSTTLVLSYVLLHYLKVQIQKVLTPDMQTAYFR